MKLKYLSTLGVAFLMLILSSCSKDEASPKPQFSFDGEAYTLKGANLYLTSSSNTYNGTHKHRDYFITDGTYVSGGGWSSDNYTNATYYLAIELAVPLANDFKKGNFPQHSDWSSIDAASNMSYISWESFLEGTDYFGYWTEDDNNDLSPVEVSGGFEDGDTMTLKFNGELQYYYYNGTNWVEETVTGKFYFTGKVQDERSF